VRSSSTRLIRASAAIDAGAGTVGGCAQPLERVTAQLLDEGGGLRASGEDLADADGRYRIGLLDERSQPATARQTDTLVLCAAGECAALRIPFVTVSMDASEGVTGTADRATPAWASWFPASPYPATAYPGLESGLGPLWYPFVSRLAVDHSGRFSVSAADIEALGKPWGLGQIESIRVSSQIEPGRFAVAVASATSAVFLPAAQRGH